ncbi:hypothetical protein OsJ_17125 [Oryza sativa Japonica Group]|uniref:GST N-terminal domain-containing protein n=1 Tax=Oryza sativa subsp. japonica TaxID=39947 RepID=B9FMG2_ORYSJ|nr:hypothetical protein OsJ_17125 [Oryza sativa Japonica Group]
MVAKVYGVAASPYVATVLVCLEEAGASYELVAVDMAAGENRSRHHLARSQIKRNKSNKDEGFLVGRRRRRGARRRGVLRARAGGGGDDREHVRGGGEGRPGAWTSASARGSSRRTTGAAEADAWGLAKIAALIGVNLADDAVFDIGAGKIRPSPGGGAKGDKAMDACAKAYDAVGVAFAEAADELGSRRYAAARQELARVAALVQRCDGGLSRAGARSPLPRYSADCQQVAIMGIAITNLLK